MLHAHDLYAFQWLLFYSTIEPLWVLLARRPASTSQPGLGVHRLSLLLGSGRAPSIRITLGALLLPVLASFTCSSSRKMRRWWRTGAAARAGHDGLLALQAARLLLKGGLQYSDQGQEKRPFKATALATAVLSAQLLSSPDQRSRLLHNLHRAGELPAHPRPAACSLMVATSCACAQACTGSATTKQRLAARLRSLPPAALSLLIAVNEALRVLEKKGACRYT